MKTHVEFANGQKMPIVGLGTWQATDEKEIEDALNEALKIGYRHIDTAYMYMNEKTIGKVLKEWLDSGRIKREELFIVTKLPGIGLTTEKVPYFMKKSLDNLQLDYVDLYLIHSPLGFQYVNDTETMPIRDGKALLDMNTDLVAVWKEMEKLVDAGYTKSIGVSNFDEDQIEKIAKIARIPIANNQVELQVYSQQKALRQTCRKYNVTICAYGPFGSPGRKELMAKRGQPFVDPGLLEDATVKQIAQSHNKTPSQILVHFIAQEGIVVIPKSVKPDRLKANIDIFDFELTASEMDSLRALDKGDKGRFFTWKGLAGVTDHPECPKWIKNLA